MKRLTNLFVLVLSVCSILNAQAVNETLTYELKLSYFGFIPDSVGAAILSYKTQDDSSQIIDFCGYGTKAGVLIKNSATVFIDSRDRIRKIVHQTLNFNENWEMNYSDSIICHFAKGPYGEIQDTLKMIDDYPPVDALAALYYLRKINFSEGYKPDIFILGREARGLKTSWKKAQLLVLKKTIEKIKGEKIECWKIIIKLDVQDNLFPGDEITLYIETDKLLPVKVISNFQPEDGLKKLLKIFVPTKIIGELE